MIINHHYKFIFLKTRKTAGTSIEMALSRFCGDGDVVTPIAKVDERARQEQGLTGPRNSFVPLRSYTKFDLARLCLRGKRARFYNHAPAAFVKQRIPEQIWNTYYKFAFERDPFDKAISRYYWSTQEPRPEISGYLKLARTELLSNWDIYAINDRIAVDFLGRYETLHDDLERVKQHLGLPGDWLLPRAKAGHRQNRDHYSQVLDQASRERIEIVCAKEIRALGYGWRNS
jgi:hypothetical protein